MALPTPTDGGAPGYYGVYPAFVTNLVDPDRLGRVEVRFPWLGTEGDRDVRAWATMCTPYANAGQGLEILPDVGSQVVVAFEAGNPCRPYVVGAAWNGRAALPHPPDRANNVRVLRTRGGSRLEFDDTGGAEKVTVGLKAGHQVVLDAGRQEVTVRHATGTVIRLTAAGGVEVRTTSTVDVTASLGVQVTTPVATFSGIVKASTVTADAFVISPAYTPGAGNIL